MVSCLEIRRVSVQIFLNSSLPKLFPTIISICPLSAVARFSNGISGAQFSVAMVLSSPATLVTNIFGKLTMLSTGLPAEVFRSVGDFLFAVLAPISSLLLMILPSLKAVMMWVVMLLSLRYWSLVAPSPTLKP